MKSLITSAILAFGVSIGLADNSPCCSGDSQTSAANEKSFKGVSKAVDQKERTILVKNFWGTKRFNIAGNCQVSLANKAEAPLTELRPGQELAICYEDLQGVLVAHRIQRNDEMFTGQVTIIDPEKHIVWIRSKGLDKSFQISEGCQVILANEKQGKITDIRPGYRVRVTYELPQGTATAFAINSATDSFTGELTAIDLGARTVKAKRRLTTKKFNLAEDCAIVLPDKSAGSLKDLKLGDNLVFSYDEVKGVNVVSRIVASEATVEAPVVSLHALDPVLPITP